MTFLIFSPLYSTRLPVVLLGDMNSKCEGLLSYILEGIPSSQPDLFTPVYVHYSATKTVQVDGENVDLHFEVRGLSYPCYFPCSGVQLFRIYVLTSCDG